MPRFRAGAVHLSHRAPCRLVACHPFMMFRILLALIAAACGASIASAQPKKLAIGDVKAGPGLVKSASKNDTLVSLEGVVQAFDSQLIDRLHGTRKFEIIARSDLKQLDKDDAVGQQGFRVPSADYLLLRVLTTSRSGGG